MDELYDELMMLRRAGNHGQRFLEELDAIHGDLKMLKRRHRVNVGETNMWKSKFKQLRTMMLSSWVIFIVICLCWCCNRSVH